MSCLEFNRPSIFKCVAQGLAHSSLNPTFFNPAVAPLRFIAGLVVAAVAPVFAICDLLIYLGACIAFPMEGKWSWALDNLQDSGILLLRFIPDAIAFPFVFAYSPDSYS